MWNWKQLTLLSFILESKLILEVFLIIHRKAFQVKFNFLALPNLNWPKP